MKYIKQFGIIVMVSFAGEMVKALIPLKIPANIYGLVLMLICLMIKVIKVEDVKETADFLIKAMPVMFIPAGVKLMVSYKVLADIFIPFVIIVTVSTVVVMAVSGKVTEFIIKKTQNRGSNK